MNLNVFRLLADFMHISSKCILIWAIHRNKTAEGVSIITQGLYLLVFATRYLDLFSTPISYSYYLFTAKVFYIASAVYILAVMQWIYPRTRERDKAWKLGIFSMLGSVIGAPFVQYLFYPQWWDYPLEQLRTFSLILESVCILPQLLLLRITTVPTVIDSYYLLALGSYRALYVFNWAYRFKTEGFIDPPALLFGIIQTVLYADFAWIYYSRQRVKLRVGGGVIDHEDVRQGFLLRPVLGRESASFDEERPIFLPDDEDGEAEGDSTPGGGVSTNGSTAEPPKGEIRHSADSGPRREKEDAGDGTGTSPTGEGRMDESMPPLV